MILILSTCSFCRETKRCCESVREYAYICEDCAKQVIKELSPQMSKTQLENQIQDSISK